MSCVPDRSIEYYLNSNDDVISQERMLYKLPDDKTVESKGKGEKIIEVPLKARLLSYEFLFK